jgi:hypothetical protein
MKTDRLGLLLALTMTAPALGGCGCGHNHQVIVQQRRGSSVPGVTRRGVRVGPPLVGVRAPTRRATTAGQVDVPIVEP